MLHHPRLLGLPEIPSPRISGSNSGQNVRVPSLQYHWWRVQAHWVLGFCVKFGSCIKHFCEWAMALSTPYPCAISPSGALLIPGGEGEGEGWELFVVPGSRFQQSGKPILSSVSHLCYRFRKFPKCPLPCIDLFQPFPFPITPGCWI